MRQDDPEVSNRQARMKCEVRGGSESRTTPVDVDDA